MGLKTTPVFMPYKTKSLYGHSQDRHLRDMPSRSGFWVLTGTRLPAFKQKA
jgi:hypothetical protein